MDLLTCAVGTDQNNGKWLILLFRWVYPIMMFFDLCYRTLIMDSPTSTSTSYKPLPRYYHVSVRVGEVTYVWGGQGKDRSPLPAAAVEVFQGHWELLPTTGTPPRAVVGSAAAAIGSTLYHYGGRGKDGYSNSLHGLEVGEKAWREVDVRNPKDAPVPTDGCGMVARGEELVVFAGSTRSVYTNDLKVFNPGNGECTFVPLQIICGCNHQVWYIPGANSIS